MWFFMLNSALLDFAGDSEVEDMIYDIDYFFLVSEKLTTMFFLLRLYHSYHMMSSFY